MNIEITEDEKAALKARVLATVEARMTADLIEEMRRSVQRESLRAVSARAHQLLDDAIAATLTAGKVQDVVDRVLADMAERQHGGIKAQIESAILRVTQATADRFAVEFRDVLYSALRQPAEMGEVDR